MYPTTIGTGPFKPAIVFDDVQYVYDHEYKSEAEAYNRAHETYSQACSEFRTKLGRQCFVAKASR